MKKVLIDIFKKYKGIVAIIVIFVVINMYLFTFPPKIIGKIIDFLYEAEKNRTFIIQNIIYLISTVIALLLVRLPWRSLSTYLSRCTEKEMKDKLFEQFLKVKMTDLKNIKNGEWMSYFTKDVGEIRAFIYRAISYGTRIVATVIIATYTMMTTINPKLTLITLCPIIITVFVVVKIKAYVEKSFKKSQKNFTELSEYVQESTDSIRTIKAYAGENSQLKKFIQINKKLKESNNAVDIHSTLLSTCINICFGLCYGLALIFGSRLVLQGKITVGDFTAFNGYIALFYGPVSWLPSMIARYKRAQISFERLDKVFQLEREKITNRNQEETKDLLAGDIVIKDLSYNYPQNIEVALSHINIEIKQGKTLGIIGTIGSGKTTLANLLLKLYPVKDGKISIGGRDINTIPLADLRKSICYITQDNFLFSTTLKDNIRLFREEFQEEEIKESTKNAVIYEDIKKMQNGIETMIGERGVDLSGGQKQRVVLSRAFLQKSNFVIFDDTFSALDNKTEEKVLENVRELTKGKTCIIISNRISDIKNADEIIVLEAGEIKERGTHNQLMEKQGSYYQFYQQQSSQNELFV